ncbi:MAG: PDDEXK nuclease domain-containing protein [Prevotella sp.]|nr:PDDEXK nuclease domain-containing protein [Prevotella sp.]
MDKSINILDQDYSLWIQDLSKRYRRSQIKASIKVNGEMLKFYWSLGRDIVAMKAESRWGSKFFKNLSKDLKEANQKATCFSEGNLKYMKNFYCMYQPYFEIGQQVADQFQNGKNTQQLVEQNSKNQFGQQVADQIWKDITSTPWGHHMLLIDKFLSNPEKALFYIHQTVENGWSRNMLLNFIGTGLYERQGKALTNFKQTLPSEDSDLAQELTKDPYCFGFTGITKPYNERILKDALLNNITTFLTELGTGFAYVGKEYRLKIGKKENFIDLLFYNLNLSCYIVIEVKIGTFTFADVGQLGGYVVACNHILRKDGRDNPTIGLLICKEKDRIQAQYALESSSQPIAISEYDLEKFYPEKLEGTMPTIEEIEAKLSKK